MIFGGLNKGTLDKRLPIEAMPAAAATPQGDRRVPGLLASGARPGLFGRSRAMALPGPISGFGGGTWNADGSPATPDQNGDMRQLPGSAPAPVLNAAEAAPNHWTVEGFDQQRNAAQAEMPRMGTNPLGGSMRRPFDYEAALARLSGEKPKIKDWQKVVAVLGDALAAHNGVQPYAMRTLMGRQDEYNERQRKALETVMGWQHGDWQNQQEADLRAANPFTSGRDRVQYDPATGQSHVIYDGPEDFETYAQRLGLKPGTEGYFKAVEDYVLKGSGPSAHERDVELDDHRTGNDASLERLRYGNRVGLETMRQGNRKGMVDYRNQHPAPRLSSRGSPRQAVVKVATPAEASRLAPGTRYQGPDGVVRER